MEQQVVHLASLAIVARALLASLRWAARVPRCNRTCAVILSADSEAKGERQ